MRRERGQAASQRKYERERVRSSVRKFHDTQRLSRTFFRLFEPDANPDVVRHAIKVTVWGRWFFLAGVIFQLAHRPSFWYPEDIELLFLPVPLIAFNGLVHYRLLKSRPMTWRWALGLSAMDIALVTAKIVMQGGFVDYIYAAYYPAIGAFAVVFSSFRLVLAWSTMTASIYAIVCVFAGAGLDFGRGDEKVLISRLVMIYFISGGISLIVRYERNRRREGAERERRMQQERIDLSQAIHDTSAQTAYIIGLGIEGAMKLAGNSNSELTRRLAGLSALSRSAMWELRGPIDMGGIFEGRELGRVLGAHIATFARITSVPAELVQSGDEPPLPTEVRTGLFSIAHNSLANAFLHAQAGRVEVTLIFEDDSIRLSVSDDGIGLPEDYRVRGRGFRGMEAEAQRLGGRLIAESDGIEGGTTIVCVVPFESSGRGE